MEPVLICKNVNKSYSGKPALKDLNLQLNSGSIVGLLGPNGSGKTTLIKLICGLLTQNSGTIHICGNPPGVQSKLNVAYMPDKTYLNEWMNAKDIVLLFKDFYTNFNAEKARDMMERLGINPLDRLKTMSKGTKEKVQLILTMSREAPLYLLDEPIGGVDPAAREYILNTIILNYNRNSTIVISTHLISDIEQVLDSFVFIRDGQIIRQSSVQDVHETENKTVDALFREMFKC